MRNVLTAMLLACLTGVSTSEVSGCWFPWAPTYSAGYGPWSSPNGGYGTFYRGYQPASYGYGSYSAGYYSAGYYSAGYYGTDCCAVACCDPCSSCGTACGGSCPGGSCGAVDAGSLRPSTDPISNKSNGNRSDQDDRNRQFEGGRTDDSGRGTYDDTTDEAPGPPAYERNRDAPLFDDTDASDSFSPMDDSTGSDRLDPDWNPSGNRGTGGGAAGSAEEVDNLLNQPLEEFGTRRTNRPPLTMPEDDTQTQDTDADAAASESDTGTETPDAADPEMPESSLGEQVTPADFLAPPSDNGGQAALQPLLLTDTRLRSSQFDVVSSSRLAAESRSKSTSDQQLTATSESRPTLQWISVPAPAGRIRL